ncbi:MAG: hypothetical protein EXQ95_14265 [Alphaproteobacteria bacterium]|nr:hypothetical protein [Alphaproteobacteria bacterium]
MNADRHHLLAVAVVLGLLGGAAPAALAQPMSPPGPERNFNRHMDGRVAFLKAELKITPAQHPAFDAYAGALRQNADEMQAAMTKHRGTHTGDTARKPATAIEQLERRAKMSKLFAAQSQRSLDAFKLLYAQFSDEQKKAADELLVRDHSRGGPPHRRT